MATIGLGQTWDHAKPLRVKPARSPWVLALTSRHFHRYPVRTWFEGISQALGRLLVGRKSKRRPELADRELLAGIARRERIALEQLYDRYAPRLLGAAVSLLGSRAPSEALLEEVFWQVWQRAPRVDIQTVRVERWLYALVYTLAVPQRRQTAPRQEPPEAQNRDSLRWYDL